MRPPSPTRSGPLRAAFAVAAIAVTCAAAAALGYAGGWLEERLFMLFFTPAWLGLVLGVVIGLGVYWLQARVPLALAWSAALALATWGGLAAGRLDVDVYVYEEAWRQAHLEGLVGPTDARLLEEDAPLIDDAARERDWIEYLAPDGDDAWSLWWARARDRLDAGVRTFGTSGLPAPRAVVAGLWLVELGLLFVLIAGFARAVTRTPRCSRCGQWMVAEPLGRVSPDALGEALDRAAAGLPVTLVSRGVSVSIERCPDCPAEPAFARALGPAGKTLEQRPLIEPTAPPGGGR